MHPILFEIPVFGGLPVYTYGVLVATGFLVGIFWIVRESKRVGLDPARSMDLVFYIIISAIIGSRILYLIVNDPSRLIKEPWSIFMIWEGGLVFYGGVIFAVTASVIYMAKNKMKFLSYADVFAPGLVIGHAIGRIGCLMAGCCHGAAAGSHWYAIVFPGDPHSSAPANIPLYPTQLIESSGDLLIFLFLVLFRKHKKFDGQIFALYLVLYSILRFFNEMLRGDTDRGYIVQNTISTAQGISIALFIMGVLMLARGYVKKRRGDES